MPEAKSPADPGQGSAPPVDEQSARTFRGIRNLAERITPWLLDVGSWIFGGLTAVNLVVLSALITVGPVDAAIRTSTAALAAALPLNVAGIILLRLIKDANDAGLDDLTLRAFQDAGFPEIDAYFPSPAASATQHARRSRVTLLYSLGIAAVSIALTVTGIAAAVWHMGHWIALVLLSAVILTFRQRYDGVGLPCRKAMGSLADVHVHHGGVAQPDSLSKRECLR